MEKQFVLLELVNMAPEKTCFKRLKTLEEYLLIMSLIILTYLLLVNKIIELLVLME